MENTERGIVKQERDPEKTISDLKESLSEIEWNPRHRRFIEETFKWPRPFSGEQIKYMDILWDMAFKKEGKK